MPKLALLFDGPLQADALTCLAESDLVSITHLRMAGLDAPQPPLNFMAIFKAACLHSLCHALQRLLHASRKAIANGFFFFLPTDSTAQNKGLFALWNRYLLHFHIGPPLGPIVVEQFLFK